MPFKEVCRMEQRVRMFMDYDSGVFGVSELCARYNVSRDVFYDWKRRRESGVVDWFTDRSHAPHNCPHKTPAALIAQIVAVRRQFRHFGPKKVRAWLMREHPGRPWPAASTIGDILKQAGLVESQPRRRRRVPQPPGGVVAQEPNDEWAIDFKGWVRTGDGRRCDPLTLSDTVSRYLLEARIGPISTDWVRPVLERAFREYGLPRAIRSDNGPPFGSDGAGGLTRLSVWWLKLGIAPHFIPPGAPQNNGRLERLHRTMGAQAMAQQAASPTELQERIDAFRRHYNEERPHEALDQDQPAVRWKPSPRAMPDRLDDPVYSPDHDVRRVRQNGYIKWRGDGVYIGEALTGEHVGVIQRDDKHHIVQFCDLALGAINPDGKFLRFAPIRHGLRKAQEPPNASNVSTIIPVQSVDPHSG